MSEVTGYTAEKMQEISNSVVVDGSVVGNDLVLVRFDESEINAGNVRGPTGPSGPPGGLGDAPSNGNTYGRKDAAWSVISSPISEAPLDGKPYVRKNGVWVLAPGYILGYEYNGTQSTSTLSTAVPFGSGGTAQAVSVPTAGVTVTFGARLGHAQAEKWVNTKLYVDDVFITRGKLTQQVPAGGGVVEMSKEVIFPAGDLSVGSHTFEIKAQQEFAEATLTMHESWISVKSN